jgi:hypothetical protein
VIGGGSGLAAAAAVDAADAADGAGDGDAAAAFGPAVPPGTTSAGCTRKSEPKAGFEVIQLHAPAP